MFANTISILRHFRIALKAPHSLDTIDASVAAEDRLAEKPPIAEAEDG